VRPITRTGPLLSSRPREPQQLAFDFRAPPTRPVDIARAR
jgi:hypothetical protein